MDDHTLAWLTTGAPPPGLRAFRADQRLLWVKHAAVLLPAWIAAHPGTRPFAWWKFDPAAAPRARLGGKGTPRHEVLRAILPIYAHGLPTLWFEWSYIATYRRLGIELQAERFDRTDPPVYEAEAEFLKRHGLLSSREAAAADYTPEVLPSEYWPAIDEEYQRGAA